MHGGKSAVTVGGAAEMKKRSLAALCYAWLMNAWAD
jgi:hypothetical protein